MMSTLEVLERTRERVLDPEIKWYFADWSHCLCGHLAAVAEGTSGPLSRDRVEFPTGNYAAVVRDLIAVAGAPDTVWGFGSWKESDVTALSDMVKGVCVGETTREHAVQVIDTLAEKVRAWPAPVVGTGPSSASWPRQTICARPDSRSTRDDVLAQLAEVVDNVEEPVCV